MQTLFSSQIMKSILTMILVVNLITFSSCTQNRTKAKMEAAEKEAINTSMLKNTNTFEEEKNKKFRIGIAQTNFADAWRAVMNAQFKNAVKKYPEFELTIADGSQDNNKQISFIEYFVQQKFDLIIISPNEAEPLADAVQRAYKSGIPVILLDRKTGADTYTQFIGANNVMIGEMAGKWVSRYLGKKGGNVAEILGSEGSSPQKERHEGFLKGISTNPNIKIVASQSSNWLRENAIVAMEKILKENKKIDVVYAHNDASAEGAYTAARNCEREKEMKFVGIDALTTPSGGIKSVLEDRLSVTYVYPTGAKEAIESAYKLLVKRENIKKNITLDTLEVTKHNASQVYYDLKGDMGTTLH